MSGKVVCNEINEVNAMFRDRIKSNAVVNWYNKRIKGPYGYFFLIKNDTAECHAIVCHYLLHCSNGNTVRLSVSTGNYF